MTDLEGRARTLSDWRDRPLTLVNFWATWCAPCRAEIPLLMGMQHTWQSRGLRIVGVAVDDAESVRRFRDELDIRYVIAVAGADALRWMAEHGNPAGALPFTVLLDARGEIVETRLGAFHAAELDAVLERAAATQQPRAKL